MELLEIFAAGAMEAWDSLPGMPGTNRAQEGWELVATDGDAYLFVNENR